MYTLFVLGSSQAKVSHMNW